MGEDSLGSLVRGFKRCKRPAPDLRSGEFPWWPPRLRRSTYVVAGLIAAALVFANIPGRLEWEPREHGFRAGHCIEHGWPWRFVRRELDINIAIPWSGGAEDSTMVAGVEPGEFWAIARHVQGLDFAGLAMNIAVAVVVLAIGVVLFEAWRRRRARLLQFYLIELFALMTATGVFFSWLSVQMHQRREERDALWRMWNVARCEEEAAGPHRSATWSGRGRWKRSTTSANCPSRTVLDTVFHASSKTPKTFRT